VNSAADRAASTRARIAEHWTASERGDSDTEHAIYAEDVITYDGAPTYSVSVMEFTDGQVSHETQYFADPFQAPSSRAALAERIPDRDR
jgi:hypothetical protein